MLHAVKIMFPKVESFMFSLKSVTARFSWAGHEGAQICALPPPCVADRGHRRLGSSPVHGI